MTASHSEKLDNRPGKGADFLSIKKLLGFSHWALIIYGLVAALSIALSQIILLGLLVYWAAVRLFVGDRRLECGSYKHFFTPWIRQVGVPVATWLFVSFIASLAGIDSWKALLELSKTAIYLLFPFCIYDCLSLAEQSDKTALRKIRQYLLALVSGQTIAALHSIVSAAAGAELPPRIPGPVTESGQLVLIIPCAVALILLTIYSLRDKENTRASFFLQPRWAYTSGAALFFSVLCFCWAGELPSNHHALRIVSGILSIIIIIPAAQALYGLFAKKAGSMHLRRLFVLSAAAALLGVCLMVNLKRGPWLGVLVILAVLGVSISRRLLIYGFAIVVLSLLLAPVQMRLGSLVEHFTIQGGRMNMWSLGMEIVGRYPLGLGPKNSSYMRTLDPSLPLLHRHMHNNFLNVAVEIGWIGLAAYIWWMIVVVSIGLSLWLKYRRLKQPVFREISILGLCLSTALLGWQVAGAVEYNFGDGEIRLIAFFFMGLLLSLSQIASRNADSQPKDGEKSRLGVCGTDS